MIYCVLDAWDAVWDAGALGFARDGRSVAVGSVQRLEICHEQHVRAYAC